MSKNYVQEGAVVDYTAGADISSGDVVVIGQSIGVALVDIANGETGSVAIEGVFDLPKVDAAVIAQGESVIWDASAGKFDDNAATPAAGDVSGCCQAMEAKGATTGENIKVKLNVGIGTVA